MENKKKLIRIKENGEITFNVIKDNEVIISVKNNAIIDKQEFSNNKDEPKFEIELNPETFGKLEHIYKISLNDKDFQSRGLKYITKKLPINNQFL
jgi:hypothetical protein